MISFLCSQHFLLSIFLFILNLLFTIDSIQISFSFALINYLSLLIINYSLFHFNISDIFRLYIPSRFRSDVTVIRL